MNLAIAGLWIFIIIFVIVFVLLTVTTQNEVAGYKSFTLIRQRGPCSPADDAPIVNDLPVCYVGGIATSFKYIPALDITAAIVPKYWLDFCRSYCTEFDTGGDCSIPSQVEAFNTCRALTYPTNCSSSATPIAIQTATNTPYYAYRPGNICDP
jgi:hypothetical protein